MMWKAHKRRLKERCAGWPSVRAVSARTALETSRT
jgi:hypothetical protein